MKKKILFFLFCLPVVQLMSQNSIGLEAGYLYTHNSVAEYMRTGRSDYLLDSVKLSPDMSSFQAVITTEIDLGKNFILSAGFHFARKGMSQVSYTDSASNLYVSAHQDYIGLSALIGYRLHFRNSKFGVQLETGPQADFAVGTPNDGALYSGGKSRFFMPFCRYNEADISWATRAGVSYKLGPGDVVLNLSYLYGLSDVLEDAFIIGRSMSVGITLGYSFRLSEGKSGK